MRKARVNCCMQLSALAMSSGIAAQAPPWTEASGLPLPHDVRSVRILRWEEPLLNEPRGSAPRRGTAGKSALLPLYGAQRGPGCEHRWLMVGPSAWVCGDHTEYSTAPPLAARSRPHLFSNGMPFAYYFVAEDGSLGYEQLSLAEEQAPDEELEPGFAVAIRQIAKKNGGQKFGLSTKGLWIPMRDLRMARPYGFEGIGKDRLAGVGWIKSASGTIFKKPGGRRSSPRPLKKHSAVLVIENSSPRSKDWYRVGQDRWLRARDLRVPRPATAPPEARPGERWIDVDTETQIVTAYEGSEAVFSTLTSTGRGAKDSELATPKGTHRIWVKLQTSDMTNLQDDKASRFYAMQEVPWVMFFKGGYGLHAAFWHRNFGNRQSHGCVNLAPKDAQRLFHFTRPALPAGWKAALPTQYDPGTLIVVR